MIPDGHDFEARVLRRYYVDGTIITEYVVLVPDTTVSGDFRHEYVQTSTRIEPINWRGR